MRCIQNAGQILELFTIEKPEWGVTEVAAATGRGKSSVSETMHALADVGLLRRTAERRYRLGWRILAMSRVLTETAGFRTKARRAMEHLVDRFGETVHLAALERGQVIYVDKMQGTRAVQVSVTAAGGKFAAHASGVGKAILAYRPWEEVVEILEREGMAALTPSTITTLEEFREELERVRERGYAYDIEEGMQELCCVAAPIRDHSGGVVASMSLAVPAYRFWPGEEKYRNQMVATACKVSQALGYTGTKRPSGNGAMREVVSESR